MEGTIPVAASLDGQKVHLYKKPDNTYAVQTADGNPVKGKLDFWLLPDPAAPRVKALAPIRFTGHTELLGPRTAKLVEGWKTTWPDDRGAAANRIEKNWKYAFIPFPIHTDSWKSFDAFEDQATALKKANCNVANTIANIYNPRQNATFGYNNSPGSKADVLSTRELHQRMTDYDATPRVRAEGAEPTVVIVPDLPYGWMAAGAGVLLYRRRIQKVAMATGRKIITRTDDYLDGRKEQRFIETPRVEYATALALGEIMIYAGGEPTGIRLTAAIKDVNVRHQRPDTALVSRRQYNVDALGPVLGALARSKTADPVIRDAARTSQMVLRVVAGKRQLVDRQRPLASLIRCSQLSRRTKVSSL